MTVHVGSLHCQLMTRSMHAQLVYLIKWFRIDQGHDTWQSSNGIKALKVDRQYNDEIQITTSYIC